MVIRNFMSNDEENELENEELPECSDTQIVTKKEIIFKVKLTKILEVFDAMSSQVENFC